MQNITLTESGTVKMLSLSSRPSDLHAEHVREDVADHVVEQVLGVEQGGAVDLGEAVRRVVDVVDDPERRLVEGQILQRRMLDDPRRRSGQHGEEEVAERARSHADLADLRKPHGRPTLHEALTVTSTNAAV
jgi:hypothetical protein